MNACIRFAIVTTLIAGVSADVDARPQRAKKDSEHYTFRPDRLAAWVSPYAERFDYITLSNRLATVVAKGDAFCKLEWKGSRVDAVLTGGSEPHRLEIALPRGAIVDDLTAYAIHADGKQATKFKDPPFETIGDTLLVVTVERPDAAPVVEVTFDLDGSGISVDETFVFQPDHPVLDGRYSFSVARDLWQDAMNAGLTWNFEASTEPNSWTPDREDTPEFFTWAWRADDMEPAAPGDRKKPREVAVTGFLPNALLAGFDSEELPNVSALDDVLAFQQRLERMLRDNEMMEGASSIAVAPPPRDTGPASSSSGGDGGLPPARPK